MASPPPVKSSPLIGSPCVLLVDDEELLRDSVTIMLEAAGARVLTAFDGQDGLEVFTRNLGAIDLVLLDYSMPRMNGYETFLAMRGLDKKVPIVIVSGLVITPSVERLRARGEIAWLSKPVGLEELCGVINRMIMIGRI
jgi:two-component system cell cycle sensor histidine kinase/response regulator CckA